jgi:aminoglycoside phosphotransferase (APT) family kinase protein
MTTQQDMSADTAIIDFARLDAFVAEALDVGVDKVRGTVLSGGQSQMTIGYFVARDTGEERVIVRVPPEVGPLAPYDAVAEATLIGMIHDRGLPVPQVAFVETNGDVLGRPFFATRFIGGTTVQDGAFSSTPKEKERLGDGFVANLASIHAQTVSSGDDPGLYKTLSSLPRKNPEAILTRWTDTMAEHRLLSMPLYHDFITTWLYQRAPATYRHDRVVHGDYRLGNLLWTDDLEVAAVLDWEEAGLGDPYFDLGWALVGARPEKDSVMGLYPRSIFLDRYQALTGTSVELDKVGWWEIAAGWTRMCMEAVAMALIAEGHYRDLRPMTSAFRNRRIALNLLRKMAQWERDFG